MKKLIIGWSVKIDLSKIILIRVFVAPYKNCHECTNEKINHWVGCENRLI